MSEVVYGLTVDKRRDTLPIIRPYLRVANVQRDDFDLTEMKQIGCDEEDVGRYSLKRGDVLIVEGHADSEEIGRAAIWAGQVNGCLHQNHIIRVRPSDQLSPEFLTQLINSERGRRYFQRQAKSTSGLYTINSTVVKRFPLPKATRVVQDEVVAEIAEVVERLRAVTNRADTTNEIRGALLSHLLTPPPETP